MAPNDKIDLTNEYIQKLEKEIESIKLVSETSYKIDGVYGKVLYQNPYKFQKEVVIATDSDQIKRNNYVVSSKGLVGVIDKVYKNRVVAKLLTNKDVIMQVQISSCYGIMKYDGALYIDSLNNYCLVSKGDKVYTSSLGYYDENILIGTINDIEIDPNNINHRYNIDLEDKLNDLNYVVIITGGKI